ncbi:MAG: ATP-binding cassette domain-containing protein [Caldilineaceae bacterium]|nr:ATP-binding cassette domain-containing protein [Caldilineaceae bacterium]
MPTTNAIQAQALTKEFQTAGGDVVHALVGLDLTVRPGEIYALLGPNGAGKTTTLSILTTLLLPTSGTATVAGFDVVRQPAEVRRRIGVTFQEIVLDQMLTGRHLLDFHGQLYGQPPAERRAAIKELAALVELEDVLDRQVSTYSGGMKRRLELARGLMTRPQLLFLDEPTQGLDPQNRAGIWRYIRRLRDEMGITLLLTTHYMDEAEQLSDRVGIVDHGQMITEGTPAALVSQLGADVVQLEGEGELQPLIDALQAESYVAQVSHARPNGNAEGEPPTTTQLLQIGVDQGDRRLVSVLNIAAAQGFQVQSVTVNRPSLGQVFLAHTGYALRD